MKFNKNLKKICFGVKNFLLERYFRLKYSQKLKLDQTTVIRELMEYTGLSRSEILTKLSTSGNSVTAKWKEMNPKTPKEEKEAKWQKEQGGGALITEGGIGSTCIMPTENYRVNEVSYYDLPSPVMEFVNWRFNKRGLDIIAISGSENQDKLNGIYDTIACLDVLEHLTNPEFHIKRLERHLSVDGYLFVTAAFATDASYPLHFGSEKTLNEMLLRCGLSPKRIIFGRATLAVKK